MDDHQRRVNHFGRCAGFEDGMLPCLDFAFSSRVLECGGGERKWPEVAHRRVFSMEEVGFLIPTATSGFMERLRF